MADAIPQDALAECMAIIGRTGAGKSFTARGLAERLLDGGARLCVLDPTGVWWGLRLDREGKTPSPYPVVIFGGDKADVPINDQAGSVVAKIVAEHRTPCVIDVSDLTYGGRTRFAADFFDTLYRSNRRDPLTLIVDEADVFAPQRPMPDQTLMFSRIEQIVRRGRVRGFRPWLITQRPAELHKSVLSQAGTLIALKLTAPQDRKAIEGWVMGHADKGQGAEVLANLAGLPRGEGWLWYPAGDVLARRKFPAIKTFDSMRTPEPGEAEVTLAPLARERLGEIVGQIEALAEQAKADDPKALKAEIARLTRELAAKGALAIPATDPREIEAARQKGYQQGRADGAREATKFALTTINPVAAAIENANAAMQTAEKALDAWRATEAPQPDHGFPKIAVTRADRFYREPPVRPATNGSGKRAGAELRILKVLAQRHPARFTMAQWATLAGMKRTGGTWQTYVSRLRSAGYLDEGDGHFGVTREGMTASGAVPEQPQSSADVIAMWKGALGTGPSKILDELVDAYPRAVDRDSLAAQTGMTASGGTFQTYLSRLSGNGLIERTRDGIRAADALFG